MVSSAPPLVLMLAALSAPTAGASRNAALSWRAPRSPRAAAFASLAGRPRDWQVHPRPSTLPSFVPTARGLQSAAVSFAGSNHLRNHRPPPPKYAQAGAPLRMASSSPTPAEGGVDVTIEYCSGCRWMLRATWLASELLTTFANEPKLATVTLVSQGPPLYDGGFFGVSASSSSTGSGGGGGDERVVLWDRKVQGRFPEAKEVKQLVRDCVNPDKDLGHSEKKEESPVAKDEDCVECKEAEQGQTVAQQASNMEKQVAEEPEQSASIPSIFYEQNRVSIEYSTGSSVESPDNGLYSATHFANELLSAMYARNAWWKQYQQGEGGAGDDGDAPVAVDSVTLIPNRLENDVLRVALNADSVVYEQPPGADSIVGGGRLGALVTQAIRNGGESGPNPDAVGMELMDDDEAEEARKFFGVF